jgi:type II secretory ATPase GspE/PulE/Tfp pilus assembly ATPase PilB-like protein
MICLNCLKAGEENKANHLKRAAHWHEKCDYKGCVCQHKTGAGYVKRVSSKETLTPTTSP